MFELTKAVIKRPVTVIVTLVGLVLFSIVSVRSMDMKLMPDINIPMMVVAATYPGASPEEVDKNVIDKIRESCSTIADMKKTITQSYENYGMVLFQVNYGADMDPASEDIRAKLDLVQNDPPDDVKTPTIIEMDFDAMDDMTLSISSKSEGVDVLKLVQDELDPQHDTVFICKQGLRSILAINTLREAGYKGPMYNLKGGIEAMKDIIFSHEGAWL